MNNFDLDLIVKVCNLKYKEKLQQKDIAKLLKLSTAKVTRILQEAFKLEILQVNIIDNKKEATKLESDIEKKFGLKRVLIVKESNNYNSMQKLLGQRVANYLLNILKDGDFLGISHSSTIRECVSALPLKISKKVEVIQLLGGSYNLTFEGLDVTRELSDRFNVSPHIIYSPLFVDDYTIKNAILSDSSIKKTFEYFNNINIALVGIGSFYPFNYSTIFKSGNLSKQEIIELQKSNVVGDVFGHFFNSAGDFCETSVENRMITIPIKNIFNIEYRIGAACGPFKSNAIRSILLGKFINILATDEKTGQFLLNS